MKNILKLGNSEKDFSPTSYFCVNHVVTIKRIKANLD